MIGGFLISGLFTLISEWVLYKSFLSSHRIWKRFSLSRGTHYTLNCLLQAIRINIAFRGVPMEFVPALV